MNKSACDAPVVPFSFATAFASQPPRTFRSSAKLCDVAYEIRGPVHEHAARLEAEGHRILKLNIGNPAPFGFEAPDVIMRDMIAALHWCRTRSPHTCSA
jgi:alanine-synthesizing transaminase